MKLLVHGVSLDIRGGIEVFLFEMSSHMPGDTVFDYVIEADEKDRNVSLPGEGEVLYVPPKGRMLSNLIGWSKLLSARRGKDAAVYFNWYSMAWLFPAMIARMKGYPVIIHAHNNNLHNVGAAHRLLHRVGRLLQRWMKITRLTNSELSARFFFGELPARIITCAIDTDKFAFREDTRRELREKLGVADRHVYGFAGRIAYQKNPLYLMDVFHQIALRDPSAAFLVCGNGDLLPEVKSRAAELGLDVIFTGAVPSVRDYYQAMDVFVLPSRFEGLGIVLIEAQCSGLPCVASADVIPTDAKVTDLLRFVPLGDPAQWADAAVAASGRRVDRAACHAVLKASNYNVETEAGRLEIILKECSK